MSNNIKDKNNAEHHTDDLYATTQKMVDNIQAELKEPEKTEIDLNQENYIQNPERCKRGSLLKLKCDVDEFFNVKTEQWAAHDKVTFNQGDGIMVTHSFEHKTSGAIVFITIVDTNMFMYHTYRFEEEFEILHKGTI